MKYPIQKSVEKDIYVCPKKHQKYRFGPHNVCHSNYRVVILFLCEVLKLGMCPERMDVFKGDTEFEMTRTDLWVLRDKKLCKLGHFVLCWLSSIHASVC